MYAEQGAMSTALQQLAGDVEKLIWLPVEINAGVRAMILIGVNMVVPLYQKQLYWR